jgi:hypothetical protein
MTLVTRPATPQHLTPWQGPGGDRRWTTVGFLEICSPAVAEIYCYWNHKRGERSMPRRADIDPAEITRHLPGIQLIDVKRDPLDFVYRLVGTREVAARGHDPTGRRVAESFFGQSADDVLANYRRVIATESFVYDLDKFTTPNGRFVHDESLFLPLADAAGAINPILIYTHYQDLWGRHSRPYLLDADKTLT